MNDKFVNKLICGDNLDELAKLPDKSVDLVCIDPLFSSASSMRLSGAMRRR